MTKKAGIALCQVRNIKWMHESFPAKPLEFLTGHYRHVIYRGGPQLLYWQILSASCQFLN